VTLLLCPVRPGDVNEELRYAMRSWEQNLVMPDGLELMTVGYRPAWLKPDHHIEGNRFKSVPLAVFDNIWLASQATGSTDTALYMNDDFFCLDPLDSVLPVKRNQSLAEQIAQFPHNAGLWWPRSLALTASWLASEGYPSPDSYEAHRPLPAQPEHMFSALSRWRDSVGWTETDIPDAVPQWRTLYGVLNEVHAHPVADCKLGMKTSGVGSPWISTSDQTWRRYGPSLVKRFQKPSRWELG
jgi:hypothetical protein